MMKCKREENTYLRLIDKTLSITLLPSFLFLFLCLLTCSSKVVLMVRTVECVDFNTSSSKKLYISNSFTVDEIHSIQIQKQDYQMLLDKHEDYFR